MNNPHNSRLRLAVKVKYSEIRLINNSWLNAFKVILVRYASIQNIIQSLRRERYLQNVQTVVTFELFWVKALKEETPKKSTLDSFKVSARKNLVKELE